MDPTSRDPLAPEPGPPPANDQPAGPGSLGEPTTVVAPTTAGEPTPPASPTPDPWSSPTLPTWSPGSPDPEIGTRGWVGGPPPPPPVFAPPPAEPRQPRGSLTAMVIVAAIVGALLGSAGSFVAFKATTPPAATAGSSAPAATTGLLPTLAPAASGGAMSVTQAAAKASPSVVTIITSDQVNQGPFSQQTQGVGSGIIFDSHGWILTNRHVVEGATSVTVQLADGRQFPGTVYGSDTLTDLAIVKVDATGWPAASVGESNDLAIGQSVIAIGSPLGDFTNTVTTGIVSALQRSLTLSNESLTGLIQTDAAINPGNSGGPLLDAAGNVIGVNTATASSAEGISFAIPIDMARPMMVQALAGKPLARAWLGVSFEPVDAGLAQQQKLGSTSGAWITAANGGSAVVTGGPAAQAGLKAGDIILSVQGVAVNNSHGLDVLIASYAPGETVTVKVLRGGSTLDVTVTLGTRPANLQG